MAHMKKPRVQWLLLLISTCFCLNVGAKDKVSLQLLWKHQFQFAGYYIAKEKGFYDDMGLEVEIREFSYETSIVDSVLQNEADFAVGRSSILIDKGLGAPITALFAAFQKSPLMLITRNDITEPTQLLGKRLMMTNDAEDVAEVQAMLMKLNITPNDYIHQKHSFDINDLVNNSTDAMGAYISNEPYQMQQLNQPFSIIHPSDFGFNMYSDILFTRSSTVQNRSQITDAFVSASIKGWLYAFSHISETAELIFQKYNSQQKSLDALIYEGEALKKLAFTEKNSFGDLSLHRFESMANIYLISGLLKPGYQIDDFIYHPTDKRQDNLLSLTDILLILCALTISIQLYRYFCMKQKSQSLQHLADYDLLTGIANRHSMQIKAQEYFNLSNRYVHPLCCLFVDIDHFKQVNDRLGHLVGDEVLKEFADLLRLSIRQTDLVSRWGGEEFLILLPNTELEAAIETAEKLCLKIDKHGFKNVKHISCSVGVTNHVPNETLDAFIERADEALYEAKHSGRNCVRSIKGC